MSQFLRSFALFLTVAIQVSAAEFTFKNRGQVVKTFSFEELQNVVPSKKITVLEPHERQKVTYVGIPMTELLDKVYGKKWREAEEMLFTCSDGYQPSLEIESFKKFTSFLAFAREGSPEFTLTNKLQNEEKVMLAPFYLVWDNTKSEELRKKGATGWPYQVVSVDLIRFSDRFPHLAPPANASSSAKRGFLAYRNYCQTCHTINGEGGTKGVELNYPTNVTEYIREDYLKKWITQPTSMRYNATMPALGVMSRNPKMLEDIIAYLKSMAQNKHKPKP